MDRVDEMSQDIVKYNTHLRNASKQQQQKHQVCHQQALKRNRSLMAKHTIEIHVQIFFCEMFCLKSCSLFFSNGNAKYALKCTV